MLNVKVLIAVDQSFIQIKNYGMPVLFDRRKRFASESCRWLFFGIFDVS